MNRVAPLSRTPLVELSRFDHPSDTVHRDPGEERAGFVTVSFVERGGFGLRVGRAHSRVDQRWVFVTWPDLVFHCDHERHAPPDDVCTSLAFEPGFASEVLWACGASHGLPAPVVPLTNRLAYLRYSLLAAASGDALGTETIAAEILGEAARPTAAPTHLFRHGQLSWYAARVDAARERLRAGYAEPHSLREIRLGEAEDHLSTLSGSTSRADAARRQAITSFKRFFKFLRDTERMDYMEAEDSLRRLRQL